MKSVYPLTSITWPYTRFSYRPTEFEYFLKLSADKLLIFKWSQAQVQFLENWKFCLLAALLKFDFKLTSEAKNSASFYRQGSFFWPFSPLSRAVTIYIQFLCSDWSKIDRWVHAGNLCNILKLFFLIAEADRVLCHLVMFNCLFPLDVQNEIQLLSRFFCYSRLVCLLGFWLINVTLV